MIITKRSFDVSNPKFVIGHKKQQEFFNRLIKEGKLSGSYIFFGEDQIGKFTFAKFLTAKLSTGVLERKSSVLRPKDDSWPRDNLFDAFIVDIFQNQEENQEEKEESIGIDKIRKIKIFLSRKPIYSPLRTVIINEADRLTLEAQNALLKIAEEPSASSLIILVLPNPEVLFSTLSSRFRKIYFSRLASQEIKSWLMGEFKIESKTASAASISCFGKPGLALELITAEEQSQAEKIGYDKAKIWHIEHPAQYNQLKTIGDYRFFIKKLLIELYGVQHKDKIRNVDCLKELLKRLTFIESLNTNKKIQLQSILWNR